jgi:hypothetical protein
MLQFRRILILVAVLALGVAPFATVRVMPAPTQDAAMADQMHAAMVGIHGAASDCTKCDGLTGASKDCLPICATMPGIVPQDAMPLSVLGAHYEPRGERSSLGAHRGPDPYPPRLIILS